MPPGVYDKESPDYLRDREDLENPDAKDNQPAGDPSDPREIGEQEQRVGRGYVEEGNASLKGSGLFRTRKRKLIGLGTGLIGGGIIGFILFFLPALRLEGYLASINRRVFASAESAVSNRMEHLLERYMITHVLNLETCKNIRTPDCRADYSKMGPAGGLFTAWRDAKIEQKLIDRFGLTFETHKSTGPDSPRITIRSSKTGKTLTLTEGQLKNGQFFGGDREFGREVNRFLRENTHWAAVLQRRSVRKYFVRKHDTKFWCFFACTARDNIDRKVRDAKTRLKYRLVERIVYPFSPKLGIIMDCLINPGGENCSNDGLRKRGIDREAMPDSEVDDIIARFEENPNLRWSRLATEKILEKILLGQVDKQTIRSAVSGIPVAGQIYLAALIIDTLDQMDHCVDQGCLSKFAADLNSRQYLEYYTAMRSAGDELKAGALSASEVGALMGEFQTDRPAEESLVYQAYNSQNKAEAALLGTKVYAASSETERKEPYLCIDGKPIPAGELVCPEKKIARKFKVEEIRNNNIVDGFVDILNRYRCIGYLPITNTCVPGPQKIVHPALQGINYVASLVIGPVVKAALDGLKAIPKIGDAISFIEKKTGELFQLFFEKIFPLPVQVDSTGREKYDALEAGGEVAASEFGKGGYAKDGRAYGLGGKKLSSEEQVAIWQDYYAQQDYDYQHSNFLAKLTNLEYPGSLANRLIADTPSSFSQLSQRFLAIFSKLFDGMASFSYPAYAGGTLLTESPFGIPRSGYTLNDPAFTRDPAELTDEYCENAKKEWQDSMKEDEVTGIDEYYVTNPCLLEQVVVEAGASALTGNDSLDDGLEDSADSELASGEAPNQIPPELWDIFTMAAAKYNISPYALAAIYGYGEHCTFSGSCDASQITWDTSLIQGAVSSAGAKGPFQFVDGTWKDYGDDCDGDGQKEVRNLKDSACGAANYLAASGARGIFNTSNAVKLKAAFKNYNHADWYANRVYDGYLELLAGIADSSTNTGTVSGDVQQLAKQILGNPNITYPLDAVSPNGSTKAVLQALANGQKAPVTCSNAGRSTSDINSNILKFLVELGSQTQIGVNALTDKCHKDGSPHYRGQSVDFECKAVKFDIARADPIATKYGGGRNSETCEGDEHWHYDF